MAAIFDDQTKTLRADVTPLLDYVDDVRYAIDPDLPGGVPLKYVKITGLSERTYKTKTITTGVVAEMDQAEKDAVDAAALAAAKAARRIAIKEEAWTYLESRYDAGEQRILIDLNTETYIAPTKPNRRAALAPYFVWRAGCVQHMKTKFKSIATCTTVEEVNAVVLNTAAMDAADPGINLLTLLDITS